MFDRHADGSLEESFGTGTAAVISPVGGLNWAGKNITVGDGGIGEYSKRLYDELTGIQYGRIEDKFGWTTAIM